MQERNARAQGVFSVDVEDWHHAELLRAYLKRTSLKAEDFPSVVVEGTREILALLEKHGVHGTFFFVGEVMERYPFLVQEVLEQGHEVGCHGWSHTMLTEMNPKEFDYELKKFRSVYANLGFMDKILGFRAPAFSLCQTTAWALEILKNNGFIYDSSIFPVKTPLYGVAGVRQRIYKPDTHNIRNHKEDNAGIIELPMTVWRIYTTWGIPVSGGFYVRVIPGRIFQYLLKLTVKDGFTPAVFYIHPWEFAPALPRLPLPIVHHWITYYGLHKIKNKVDGLLKTFRWSSCQDFLSQRGCIPVRMGGALNCEE